MAAMMFENEIRAQITPWEKGTLIIATVDEGHSKTPDAANAALYASSKKSLTVLLACFFDRIRRQRE